MIAQFLVIKARFDNNVEDEWEIINLVDPGRSDCFARKEVVLDIDTCLDNDKGETTQLDEEPHCSSKCDFTKKVHHLS